MGPIKIYEEFSHSINVDENHAQILIEITSTPNTFQEAKRIIEELGIQILETNHLSSNWILVKLNVKDMRNIALKMTEHGFFIHGINALNFGTF